MALAVALRLAFTAAKMRALARSSGDANQVRGLPALAVVYEGATRGEAPQLGGVGLQAVRDWVPRFNAAGPDGLIDAARPSMGLGAHTNFNGRSRRSRIRVRFANSKSSVW